jgi:hypothetical protein
LLLITSTSNFSTNEFIAFVISDCLGSPAGLSTYRQIHDTILPKKIHANLEFIPVNSKFVVSPKKATANKIESLHDAVLAWEEKRIANVHKNAVIQEYKNSFLQKHGLSGPVTSSKKGEPTNLPTNNPTITQLVCGCTMKPSLNHQYLVDGPSLGNFIVILIKDVIRILSDEEILRMHYLSKLFNEVIVDVLWLRILDFLPLLVP